MKIAYLLGSAFSGGANGVRIQAETWAKGLKKLGHQVDLISPWGNYHWQSYDVIHFLGYGTWLEMVPALAQRTTRPLLLSPIMDSNRPAWLNRFVSHIGGTPLHLTSPLHSLGRAKPYIAAYYARSDYENFYIQRSLGVDKHDVVTLPLPCRFSHMPPDDSQREPFCLHVSILSSENKNVPRLISAAIKYGFRLILAGKAGTRKFESYLKQITSQHNNIEYAGFLSEQEMIALFSRAKVFALPSLFEGVGLVGLEAAALGADIVLTNRGAPKEYYKGMAYLVNPESVDEIGQAVVRALSEASYQPALSEYVKSNYNQAELASQLEMSYEEAVTLSSSKHRPGMN